MSESPANFRVQPGGSLRGELRVPGDKSISHRAIMLGSLAQGTSHIDGFLEGEDSLATLQAFRAMGVKIEGPADGKVLVHGVGQSGLQAPSAPLDLGNSGTSMRLLAGLLLGQGVSCTLTGDASLTQRPMNRIAEPLRAMGGYLDTAAQGRPPLRLHAARKLSGIDYVLPMASAQVKSALLLAGLNAEGRTTVEEPAPTRDHTERMLRSLGYTVDVEGRRISLNGGAALQSTDIRVPCDISSAAFFLVAASIAPDSEIVLRDVGVNPTRTGVIEILRAMGARIDLENPRDWGAEPVADIRVRSAPLRGVDIPPELVPLAIDEFPVIFIAASCAEGTTRLREAAELRVKESDRIAAMAEGLHTLGVQARPHDDGIEIHGGEMHGGIVQSHGDHRIAMAFTVAGLRADANIEIEQCENVATSFPGFLQLASSVGMRVSAC